MIKKQEKHDRWNKQAPQLSFCLSRLPLHHSLRVLSVCSPLTTGCNYEFGRLQQHTWSKTGQVSGTNLRLEITLAPAVHNFKTKLKIYLFERHLVVCVRDEICVLCVKVYV